MSQHFQPNKFVPPRPDQLPPACGEAVAAVIAARVNWQRASDALASTEASLRTASGDFEQALRDAGRDGQDVSEIQDETPTLTALRDRQVVALSAAHQSVLAAWHTLCNVVSEHWDEAVALADGPCSDADVLVRAAEERLAEAHRAQAGAIGMRSWLSSRRHPQSPDATRANANGPRPRPDMDLEQLRAGEDKSEVRRKIEQGLPLTDDQDRDEAAPHIRNARRGFW